jgi:phosphoribosylanthranilate isomerase
LAVRVAIKFCGLTREEDAARARELGAGYCGVVFAGGPRELTADRAARVLGGVSQNGTLRVGVFATDDHAEIVRVAELARLDVVQLYVSSNSQMISRLRSDTSLELWAVARIAGDALPNDLPLLFDVADAVLLDARAEGQLGGSGKQFNWEAVAPMVQRARGGKKLVVAGGLSPMNVARAIAALQPDVVDVSSGVESSPGIKDHALMRDFVHAVSSAAGNDH